MNNLSLLAVLVVISMIWPVEPALSAADTLVPPSSSEPAATSALSDGQPISVEGTLVPVREVHIASRSRGVISFISEEGDRVHAGDPILILEDSQEKLEVDRQKKILELRAVEEKDEEALRKKDIDSPLEFAGKQLNLELAKINVAQAEDMLTRRTVTAPFDGIITKRVHCAGEAADELSPVLTMVDINHLYLEFHLPAAMRNRIKEGQSVSIQVDTPAPAEAKGTVQLCSPVIDPASEDFEVRVLIPNPGNRLTAGVMARGIIDPAIPSSVPSSSPTPVTAVSR